jgi:hypothetical protein
MRTKSIIAALLLFAAVAHAEYTDFYVIPVASHVTGAFGTFWMSDVAVQNFQNRTITVNLALVEADGSVSAVGAPVTVAAGGSAILRDVLAGQGKSEVSGAILIGADAPFAVSSRTYVTAAGGGTIGQGIPAAARFVENTLDGTANGSAFLPGLVNNTQFRSNIGFVAGTSNSAVAPLVIEVTLRDGGGSILGTRTFEIPAGAFRHLQFSSRAVADQTFDAGSAEVRIAAGDGAAVAYASIVDNVSADSVFVMGEFPQSGSGSAFRALFRASLFAGRTSRR